MNLVGRERTLEPRTHRQPRAHPDRVVPFVVGNADDGRREWRNFERKSVRIGLEQQFAVWRAELELVPVAGSGRRDEDLPDAARAKPAHHVDASVPPVEITDDAGAGG